MRENRLKDQVIWGYGQRTREELCRREMEPHGETVRRCGMNEDPRASIYAFLGACVPTPTPGAVSQSNGTDINSVSKDIDST